MLFKKKNLYISLFCGQLQTPFQSLFGQICNFRDPTLVTFYLCIYTILNEEHSTFHLQYKHSGTFANRKYEELSYPKNQKMCDPIVVTLLKMRPHYNQSSRENPTSSSGTSLQFLIRNYPPPHRGRGGAYVFNLALKIEKKVELKNLYLNFD